jgi:hypothetical protein
MNETTLPLYERGLLMFENPRIPYYSYMPASHDDYLHKKWITKTSSSIRHNCLQIIIRRPLNLQISPNMLTEIIIEKQVYSIRMYSKRA